MFGPPLSGSSTQPHPHLYMVCISRPQTGWQGTRCHPNTQKTPRTYTKSHTHTHARAVSSLHTTTSTETRENVVGRGERDCVGGSRRKRWRKRQRESRSEWHMAFSLKKDEQHKTKRRICINQRWGWGDRGGLKEKM